MSGGWGQALFSLCRTAGQGAMGTNWSIGSSVGTWGRTSSLWGWWSTGRGCPGRLWSLLLWRYSRPTWTWSCAACCRFPCFCKRVGLDDPERSFPTPNILWFCDSVISPLLKHSFHCDDTPAPWICRSWTCEITYHSYAMVHGTEGGYNQGHPYNFMSNICQLSDPPNMQQDSANFWSRRNTKSFLQPFVWEDLSPPLLWKCDSTL